MTIKCAMCKKELQTPDEMELGQALECPFCEKRFWVGQILDDSNKNNVRFACSYCSQRYSGKASQVPEVFCCTNCNHSIVLPKINYTDVSNIEKKSREPKRAEAIIPPKREVIDAVPVDTKPVKIVPAASVPVKIVSSNTTVKNSASTETPPMGIWKWTLLFLGNYCWLVFGGLYASIICFFGGIILCLTIIGIPFGLQIFKVSCIYLSPFGAEITRKSDKLEGCLTIGMNIFWMLICGGLISALVNLIWGTFLCTTIVGIPWGLQYFKLARLIISPFGLKIVRRNENRTIALTAIIAAILTPTTIATILILLLVAQSPRF